MVSSCDPNFTDANAASMILYEDHSYAMLLTKSFFQSFFPHKAIADANTCIELSVALQCDSKAEVDALVAKAVAAGVKPIISRKIIGLCIGMVLRI